MSFCPCGSSQLYETCCGLYIEGKCIPPTPEALMRSRYTAYTQANISYIDSTMKDKAKVNFDKANALTWAKEVVWLDLKVLNSKQLTHDRGEVEFIARFIEENRINLIHEISEFRCDERIWYYIGGRNPPLISASKGQKIFGNTICPCGSLKIYKNCHGARNIR